MSFQQLEQSNMSSHREIEDLKREIQHLRVNLDKQSQELHMQTDLVTNMTSEMHSKN